MRTFQLLILSALLIGGVIACTQTKVDPSNAEYDRNDTEIQTYATAKKLQGKLTASGLYYVITKTNPTGKQPALGEETEFTYKSYNLKDVLVDSTVAGVPVYYPYGIRAILAGLEEGIGLMREGEKATFLIPSYLGYNDRAVNANLPSYSVVRFDVQLNRSRTEDQQIDEYITTKKLTVTEKTASGVRFIRTSSPTSTTIGANQTLTIRYKGSRLRGASAFDSTGTGTFDAVLGQNKYVKGFEEGLSKMNIGEKATIIFPSSLGYGTQGVTSNGTYIITPYAPLRFDLEVVSAK